MKKRYLKSQFLKDVAKEARLLRKTATQKELDKLDFSSLDPGDKTLCIYGQATGNCRSKRAISLISACCRRFIVNNYGYRIFENGFQIIAQNVNGTKNPIPQSMGHLSSIEAYILMPKAKNKNLIAYLKGEREDLVL